MSNFAFQGFGLGEFFKARERLVPLLTNHFSPPLLAPSSFLALSTTLYSLADSIERLFDENSNPNSAILRNDNKLSAQQMLRITSHGLLDTLEDLENLLRIPQVAGDMTESRWWNFMTALRLSGLEVRLEEISERFAFLEWKLGGMFFQTLRRSKVTDTLPHLQRIQGALSTLLLNHRWLFSTPSNSDADSTRTTIASSNASILSIGTSSYAASIRSNHTAITSDARSEYSVATIGHRNYQDALNLDAMIQKFQDACEWMMSTKTASGTGVPGSGNHAVSGTDGRFQWKLKEETTLLVLMHWVFKAKYALRDVLTIPISNSGTPAQIPLSGYLNLLKSAWILQVSHSSFLNNERNHVPEEAAVLAGLLSTEVINLFQRLHEREDIDIPPGDQILLHGDFSVVVDTQNTPKRPCTIPTIGSPSLSTISGAHSISERSEGCETPTGATSPTFPRKASPTLYQFPGSLDESPYGFSTSRERTPTVPPARSTLQNFSHPIPSGSGPHDRRPFTESNGSLVSMTPSLHDAIKAPPGRPINVYTTPTLPLPSPSTTQTVRSRIGSTSSSDGRSRFGSTSSSDGSSTGGWVGNGPLSPGPGPKSGQNYSWGAKIDKVGSPAVLRALGEIEIMPRELAAMTVQASYTGDVHGGRWDESKVRLFKEYHSSNTGGAPDPIAQHGEHGYTTVRILTTKEGSEESVDQRYLHLEETEMVPEYGYHENFPVIYLRKMATRPNQHPQSQKESISNKDANQGKRNESGAGNNSPTAQQIASMSSAAGISFENASLFYKFKTAHDMFTFQLACLGEAVESDVRSVRMVKYKRSIVGSEHCHYRSRIQIWKEVSEPAHTLAPHHSTVARAIAGNTDRANPDTDRVLKVHSTRVVMYWDDVIVTLFVTDSIDIERRSGKGSQGSGGRTLRIRPSSHKSPLTFKNPTCVKARTLGTPSSSTLSPSSKSSNITTASYSSSSNTSSSGGVRLDKRGLTIEDEENGGVFEEYRWFEIEFGTSEEAEFFFADFNRALVERRKERKRREELLGQAARGVRLGSVGGT